MSWDSFRDATVVVTGGAGGIGQAVVPVLLDSGANVAVLDLGDARQATMSVRCDVTDPDRVNEAFDHVVSALGPPRHVVCAAGVVSELPIAELEFPEWRRVLDVSLTGTYLAAKAALPHLVQQEGASIVALSSGYATSGYRYGGHYAAAKAGVEAFVKSLALEVAPWGVRANTVAPGPVLTDFVRHVSDFEGWRRDREARIPLGRIAEPADVVDPVLFLLSPASRYITGQVLHVNGGLLMP